MVARRPWAYRAERLERQLDGGGGGGANGGFGADFSQGLGVDDFPLLVGVGAGEAQSQYDALLSQVRALPQ